MEKNRSLPMKTAPADAEIASGALDPRISVLTSPDSPATRQYQMLAFRLACLVQEENHRRILVTSAVGGEGKTTIACNCALAVAATTSLRVALVDANLGAPCVHRSLGLGAHSGVTDVVSGDLPLDECLWQLDGSRLSVLPAGRPTVNPTGLLMSDAASRLFVDLGERFDLVLVDGAPLLTTVDSRWMARKTDGTVLVVRAGRTPRHFVRMAVDALDGSALLGTVVNDVSEVAGGWYGRALAQAPSGTRVPSRLPANRLLGSKKAA